MTFFFETIKYKDIALSTKASACLTSQNLEKYLPSSVNKIIVKNVLFELARITRILYPLSDVDYPDLSLKNSSKTKYKKVRFGNNV